MVRPGDLIFGDIDGVVMIPVQIGLEVINKSYEKVISENKIRNALLKGMLANYAYDKYRIL